MEDSFRRLGVDARVGEIPGEYCPGAYSVNARGVKKLMGVGQRLVPSAAHVGGVVVVNGANRVQGRAAARVPTPGGRLGSGDGGQRCG